MSWIFGCIGTNLSQARQKRLAAAHAPPIYRATDDLHVYVAGGGLAATCLHGELSGADPGGWMAVGLGLRRHDGRCRLLTAHDWQALLARKDPDFSTLDGHFAAVRWHSSPPQITCFTDPLGLRTLYLAASPTSVAFSTRLDWLAAWTDRRAIDFEAFGSHWLTFNQLSTESLLQDLRRLGPGGRAVCTPTSLQVHEQPWMPGAATNESTDTFDATLDDLVHPLLPPDHALSLGLSGGLDSRLLLALAASDGRLQTHVFGHPSHPDVALSRRIAAREGLTQRHFYTPVPEADGCLALLRSHVAQTQAVSPASSVLGLRYYPELHAQGITMIDGGFGEAARRQFMNRLLRRGRAALRHGDPEAILPHLYVPRADIFTEETLAMMRRGARQHIDALWQRLPPMQRFGEENVLDLLSVWTRLPNFFGFEQNRLDGLIQNYMPFAQPSLLQALFRLPVRLRRGGRLFRHLIRTRYAALARYPLVKGHVTYPFFFPTLPAYLYAKVKTRIGPGFTDPTRRSFLKTLQPFVLDAVHAAPVRTYAAYDQAKLVRLVEGFYNGQNHLAAQVDWWLAFEMWRRVVEGTA